MNQLQLGLRLVFLKFSKMLCEKFGDLNSLRTFALDRVYRGWPVIWSAFLF